VNITQLHVSALADTLEDIAERLLERVTTGDALRFVDVFDRIARFPTTDRADTPAEGVVQTHATAVDLARERLRADLARPETLAPFREAVEHAFRGHPVDIEAWGEDLLQLAGALGWLEGGARAQVDDAVAYGLEGAALMPEIFRACVGLAAWRIEVEPLAGMPPGLARALRDLVSLPGLMVRPAAVVTTEKNRPPAEVVHLPFISVSTPAPLGLAADGGEADEPELDAWTTAAEGPGWEIAWRTEEDDHARISVLVEVTRDQRATRAVNLRAEGAVRLLWAEASANGPPHPPHRPEVLHNDRIVLRLAADQPIVVVVPGLGVIQRLEIRGAHDEEE
jgi:hypothetical protein